MLYGRPVGPAGTGEAHATADLFAAKISATFSEIHVEADSGNYNGPACLVVAGIVDVLDIKGPEESAPEVRGIESLEYFFVAVGERAIAEKKALAAEGEILLVGGDDGVEHENGAGAIVAAMPGIALGEAAELKRPVHL